MSKEEKAIWGANINAPFSTTKQEPTFNSEQQPSGYKASFNSGREEGQYKLAEKLLMNGYHPVMLFGTRASGKSSLLASLLHYLQSDPESPAIPVQGEWLVSTDSTYGQSVADATTKFMTHVLNNFHDGQAAPSTRDEFPFYIPIILRPNNGQPEVKIAFLESRGEFYAIDKNSKDLYKELRDEVSDVYINFPKSISILLIGPYVMGDAYSHDGNTELSVIEMKESDTALFGALQAYQRSRSYREHDKYLFLLTKWDAHTRSISDSEFKSPPRGLVSHLISERYPKSWNLFQIMQPEEAESMQYSAGLMSGTARIEVPAEFKPIMAKYPKKLWSWLYTNASNGGDLFGYSSSEKASGSTFKLAGFIRKILT
jgi:hypothetical protein